MNLWLIIIISIFSSALFSGLEIAFVSANKLVIELEKNKGSFAAKLLSKLNQNPSNFIATMLVGNNISLVVYGIVMSQILSPFLFKYLPVSFQTETIILLIQTIISTGIILITAEFIPKSIFRINPNYLLKIFAAPAFLLYYMLYPLVFVAVKISAFTLKYFFKTKFINNTPSFGHADLDNFIKEASNENNNEENERDHDLQIFQNAIDFRRVKVRDCMIPRTEIIALEQNESIELLKTTFVESGLSKVLIYDGSIDNIIGYTHSYDIFKNPVSIKDILRPIIIVTETMPASKMLTMFIQQHKSVAVVVDEFGGTSGLVTIEDVMEEIFGEIDDEFDTEEPTDKQISENEFVFTGRAEIDQINEKFHLDLPESNDYETIGGLIFHHHQSIPSLNEEITIGNYVFIITKVSETRIEQVVMKKVID